MSLIAFKGCNTSGKFKQYQDKWRQVSIFAGAASHFELFGAWRIGRNVFLPGDFTNDRRSRVDR